MYKACMANIFCKQTSAQTHGTHLLKETESISKNNFSKEKCNFYMIIAERLDLLFYKQMAKRKLLHDCHHIYGKKEGSMKIL